MRVSGRDTGSRGEPRRPGEPRYRIFLGIWIRCGVNATEEISHSLVRRTGSWTRAHRRPRADASEQDRKDRNAELIFAALQRGGRALDGPGWRPFRRRISCQPPMTRMDAICQMAVTMARKTLRRGRFIRLSG